MANPHDKSTSGRQLLITLGVVVISSGLSVAATSYFNQKADEQRVDERAQVKAEAMAAKLLAEKNAIEKRFADLEKKQALIEKAAEPINTAYQKMLIDQLTNYHTPEMDALLVKLGPPYVLTDEEAARLNVLIEARTRDLGNKIPEAQRDAAKMLPFVMKRVRAETLTPSKAGDMDLRVVSVPNLKEGTKPKGKQ